MRCAESLGSYIKDSKTVVKPLIIFSNCHKPSIFEIHFTICSKSTFTEAERTASLMLCSQPLGVYLKHDSIIFEAFVAKQ